MSATRIRSTSTIVRVPVTPEFTVNKLICEAEALICGGQGVAARLHCVGGKGQYDNT